jgi:hypothetical protein
MPTIDQPGASSNMDHKRRQVVVGMGAGALVAPMAVHAASSACGAGDLKPGSLPEGGVASPPKGAPIRIDAHCHVFNAQDIPIKRFLTKVMAHDAGDLGWLLKWFGPLIASLAKLITPTSCEELETLSGGVEVELEIERQQYRFVREFMHWSNGRPDFAAAFDRQASQYNEFRGSLGVGPVPRVAGAFSPLTIVQILADMHSIGPTEEDRAVRTLYQRLLDRRDRVKLKAKSDPWNLVRFAYKATSPRFLNLSLLQRTYQRDPATAIDLFCPSMLDFDYWLGEGGRNGQRQADGIRLMEQLAIASNGAFLPLVAYNPWGDLGASPGAALARVQDAIQHRGFVGVKLYPPIRFDPGLGTTWKRDACPPNTKEINDALKGFYAWAKDIPVMAHGSHSIGASDDDEQCASPERWEQALHEVPGMMLQIGHFGGSADAAQSWPGDFAALMDKAYGSRLRADLSNHDDLFDDPMVIRKFKDLLRAKLASGGWVADRVLYGSDFYMTDMSGATRVFAQEMRNFLRDVEAETPPIAGLRDRVMGLNAVDFYGLRKGDPTRTRLEDFYRPYGIVPRWMCRVDDAC